VTVAVPAVADPIVADPIVAEPLIIADPMVAAQLIIADPIVAELIVVAPRVDVPETDAVPKVALVIVAVVVLIPDEVSCPIDPADEPIAERP